MRTNTINNLANSIRGVRIDICERLLKMFSKADAELGNRLGQQIGVPAIKSRL